MTATGPILALISIWLLGTAHCNISEKIPFLTFFYKVFGNNSSTCALFAIILGLAFTFYNLLLVDYHKQDCYWMVSPPVRGDIPVFPRSYIYMSDSFPIIGLIVETTLTFISNTRYKIFEYSAIMLVLVYSSFTKIFLSTEGPEQTLF